MKKQAPARKKASKRQKSPAKKKAARRKKGFPFPFFGSGDASYFEFVSLVVVFERPVSRAGLKWARTILPPILEGSLDRQKDGEMWLRLFMGEERGSEFFAENPEHRINRAIEKWLVHLDRRYSIVCAFRPEDREAEGTEYDEWHLWSLENPPDPDRLEGIPSPVGTSSLLEGLTQVKKDTRSWQKRQAKRKKSRRKPKKGDRVKIIKGGERGARGEIFWEGQSRYRNEQRFGIRDGQHTYWADADQVELVPR